MREGLKGVTIAVTLWVGLVTLGNSARADDNITMDIIKTYGGGGTTQCPSVRACYLRVLENEVRGATEYCETITIKRNGRAIWHRDYNSPYWVKMQKLTGHDRAWFSK